SRLCLIQRAVTKTVAGMRSFTSVSRMRKSVLPIQASSVMATRVTPLILGRILSVGSTSRDEANTGPEASATRQTLARLQARERRMTETIQTGKLKNRVRRINA